MDKYTIFRDKYIIFQDKYTIFRGPIGQVEATIGRIRGLGWKQPILWWCSYSLFRLLPDPLRWVGQRVRQEE